MEGYGCFSSRQLFVAPNNVVQGDTSVNIKVPGTKKVSIDDTMYFALLQGTDRGRESLAQPTFH